MRSEKQRSGERRIVRAFVPRAPDGSTQVAYRDRLLAGGIPASAGMSPALPELWIHHQAVDANDGSKRANRRMRTEREIRRLGKVYVCWPSGVGAECRMMLTVRRGKPVIDIRFGELTGGRWRPSSRGVPIPLSSAEAVARAFRSAIADAKRFGLFDAEYTPSRNGRRIRR